MKYNDKLSKIFGIVLLASVVSLVLVSYSMAVEQHVGILYLKHTFNQSATNFEVLNESRLIHADQIRHELQIANDTRHIDRMLTQINHTLFDILQNGHK
jgi:hypothetical protein